MAGTHNKFSSARPTSLMHLTEIPTIAQGEISLSWAGLFIIWTGSLQFCMNTTNSIIVVDQKIFLIALRSPFDLFMSIMWSLNSQANRSIPIQTIMYIIYLKYNYCSLWLINFWKSNLAKVGYETILCET
jgi:hypothetical protein